MMICTLNKGHKGQCVAGTRAEAGTCRKTAERWFAEPDDQAYDTVEMWQEDVTPEGEIVKLSIDPDIYFTAEEMATMTEGELAMAYRRTHVPSTMREATEWARDYIENRG